jgi:hypothetical protein
MPQTHRLLALAVIICATTVSAEPVSFRAHSITEDQSTYQVRVVDMNVDGRPDIVASSPQVDQTGVYWYENPSWERHLIASSDEVKNIALWITHADLEGDEIPELVITGGFSPRGVDVSTGEIYYLVHQGDPEKPWAVRQFNTQKMSHRAELADFDGDGKIELVNAPIVDGPASELKHYEGQVPLLWYTTDDWQRNVIHQFTGHVHGMIATDFDGKGGTDVLTAGFEGIWLHRASPSASGPVWRSEMLVPGLDTGPELDRGASDMRVGHLAKGEVFFIAPEPFHSGNVFVYTRHGDGWKRTQFEDSLTNSHALATGDLNGDGIDEIVLGNRTGNMSTYVYYADNDEATEWTRVDLDSDDMGGTDCNISDLNGDGRNDIVCGGHFSNNIRWYENLGP